MYNLPHFISLIKLVDLFSIIQFNSKFWKEAIKITTTYNAYIISYWTARCHVMSCNMLGTHPQAAYNWEDKWQL